MSLTLTREALSNQIADDLATRNLNKGLIESAVNAKAESADVYTKTENDSLLGAKESIANVNTLKGAGWAGETVKKNADDITTLNGDDSTEGSVAKTVKDAVDPISTELSTVKVKTTENDLAIQAIQRDQNLANQSEAKITTSDYGIVALPKNATGNLKMKREGLTARNLVNGASVAIGGTVTFASVLSNIYYDVLNKVQITGTGSDITATNNSGAIANMAIINLTQTFSSIPTLAQCKNIFPSYFADTKNVPMTGRYRGTDRDGTTKHDLYLTAPEGRSVPSAKDSVEVQDGKLVHVKRVSGDLTITTHTSVLSYTTNKHWILSTKNFITLSGLTNAQLTTGGMIVAGYSMAYTDYDSATIQGKIYINNTDGTIRYITPLATTDITAIFPLTVCYKLAIPITTPIDSDGNVPAGASVLWEPAIPDVGIYTTRFEILDTTHPIASIDKLYKVDFVTGVQTEITDAVVAGDGLSFTSASLTDGDLVNVIYFYATANPEGLTTVGYWNSNVVVADSVNGKYYKYKPVITNGAIASWTLTEVV